VTPPTPQKNVLCFLPTKILQCLGFREKSSRGHIFSNIIPQGTPMKPLSRPLRIHTSLLLLATLGACGKSKSRSAVPPPESNGPGAQNPVTNGNPSTENPNQGNTPPTPAEPLKASWDWPLAGEEWVNDGREGVTLPAQEPHWAWQGQGKPVVVAESTTCPQEVFLLKENGLEVNSKEELLPKLEPLFTSAGSCQIALAAEAAPQQPLQFLTLNLRSLHLQKACEAIKGGQKTTPLQQSIMKHFEANINEYPKCWDFTERFVSREKGFTIPDFIPDSPQFSPALQEALQVLPLLPRVTGLAIESAGLFNPTHLSLLSHVPDMVTLTLKNASFNLDFKVLSSYKNLKTIYLEPMTHSVTLNHWPSLKEIPAGVYLNFPLKYLGEFTSEHPWPSHVGMDWSGQEWTKPGSELPVPVGVKSLDLSHMELTSLEGLKQADQLEELFVNENKLGSLKGLEKMPNLKVLGAGSNQLTDISALHDSSKLETLDLEDNRLTSLKGLENKPSLKGLDADNNHLTDISALQDASKLEQLDAYNNQLTSLKGLDNKPNLKVLVVEYNQLTDISALQDASKLESLDLRDNQLTSLKGLENKPNLKVLGAGDNQLTDISALQDSSKLEQLNLWNNKLTSLKELENKPNLKFLDASRNQLTDISALQDSSKLETLDLEYNRLTSLKGLENKPSLKFLNASCSGGNACKTLTDISALQDASKLEELNLWNNQLTSLRGLENKPNLKFLDASWNQLTDISALQDSSKLYKLLVYNNQLTSLKGLENKPNLKSLNAGYNPLTDISALQDASKLETLDLEYNRLTSLKGLENKPNLKFLDAGSNQLTDISALQDASKLESIDLERNQLTSLKGLENKPNLMRLSVFANPLDEATRSFLRDLKANRTELCFVEDNYGHCGWVP
jgi:internalin A